MDEEKSGNGGTSGAGSSEQQTKEPAKSSSSLGVNLGTSEWPAKVAHGVEGVVVAVQDRAIRPLIVASRAVVFGLIIASMVFVLSIVFAIAVIRLLDVYAFGHRVWAADALVGAILVALGAFAWTKRTTATSREG
jgi:hypothetical protein